ncbi:MAG TPA: hypothetical protein VMX16_08845 [Terriglobia bacterium]|nr:hypothetical protein [Terriglobia bacterium]
MSNLEKWIHNHPALAHLILLILAGINAWSAWHVFSRSPILALVQGILSVLLLLGAMLVP